MQRRWRRIALVRLQAVHNTVRRRWLGSRRLDGRSNGRRLTQCVDGSAHARWKLRGLGIFLGRGIGTKIIAIAHIRQKLQRDTRAAALQRRLQRIETKAPRRFFRLDHVHRETRARHHRVKLGLAPRFGRAEIEIGVQQDYPVEAGRSGVNGLPGARAAQGQQPGTRRSQQRYALAAGTRRINQRDDVAVRYLLQAALERRQEACLQHIGAPYFDTVRAHFLGKHRFRCGAGNSGRQPQQQRVTTRRMHTDWHIDAIGQAHIPCRHGHSCGQQHAAKNCVHHVLMKSLHVRLNLNTCKLDGIYEPVIPFDVHAGQPLRLPLR